MNANLANGLSGDLERMGGTLLIETDHVQVRPLQNLHSALKIHSFNSDINIVRHFLYSAQLCHAVVQNVVER